MTDDKLAAPPLPSAVSPKRIRRALLRLGALVVFVVIVITLLPGLGQLRKQFDHAAAGWIVVACVLEVLSTFSYVLAFRVVFCTRMSWGTTYKIGMSELGADSLLPVGGAGGLALGAWALRRGGMPAGEIARKTVAFFLLTSLPNVLLLALLGLGLAIGLLPGHPSIALAVVPAAVAIGAIATTLAVGRLTRRIQARVERSRLAPIVPGLRAAADGVEQAVSLLKAHHPLLLVGLAGYLAFDILVLWASFHALGSSPELPIVAIAYIIGQLGNLIPVPGGIGGVEGGLIGTLVLYGLPAVSVTAVVLLYRAIQLWIPGILGSTAFVQLRRLLNREAEAIELCQPGQVVEIIGRGPVVAGPASGQAAGSAS